MSNERFNLILRPNEAGGNGVIPVEFGLQAIYPSPFNSTTTIRFGIDIAEQTSITVYDLLGREVVKLFEGVPDVGYHQQVWKASDMPSGLFIVRLESGGRVQNSKVALIR